MEFEEQEAILSRLEGLRPNLLHEVGVLGVFVAPDEEEAVLTVRVDRSVSSSVVDEIEKLSPLRYTFKGRDSSVEVRTETGEKFIAIIPGGEEAPPGEAAGELVLPGDFSTALDSFGYGTAGWNIFFDGVLCTMSCWHVFCFLDSDTPPGTKVNLKGNDIAEILAGGHVRVRFQGIRNWLDMALARYDDPRQAGDRLRACGNGTVLPYPGQMASSVTAGDRLYKVGARQPVCRSGEFVRLGDVKIEYDNKEEALFYRQLVLTKMTGKGDSGSLAVRVSDNRIVGLNFAQTSTETLANPIFRLPWTYQGTQQAPGGRIFPAYKR